MVKRTAFIHSSPACMAQLRDRLYRSAECCSLISSCTPELTCQNGFSFCVLAQADYIYLNPAIQKEKLTSLLSHVACAGDISLVRIDRSRQPYLDPCVSWCCWWWSCINAVCQEVGRQRWHKSPIPSSSDGCVKVPIYFCVTVGTTSVPVLSWQRQGCPALWRFRPMLFQFTRWFFRAVFQAPTGTVRGFSSAHHGWDSGRPSLLHSFHSWVLNGHTLGTYWGLGLDWLQH